MSRQSTLGHSLLRDWLRSQGERGNRKDDSRPDFPTLRAFLEQLNGQADAPDQLRSAYAIYDWIEGSLNPRPPGRPWRSVIERLSGGAVPASAWEAPAFAAESPDAVGA
jgi:hypothetical protein